MHAELSYLTISEYRQIYLWSSEIEDRTLHRLEPLGFLRGTGAKHPSQNWIRTGGSAGTINIYTLLVNTMRERRVLKPHQLVFRSVQCVCSPSPSSPSVR
jgi:hypothetical protein